MFRFKTIIAAHVYQMYTRTCLTMISIKGFPKTFTLQFYLSIKTRIKAVSFTRKKYRPQMTGYEDFTFCQNTDNMLLTSRVQKSTEQRKQADNLYLVKSEHLYLWCSQTIQRAPSTRVPLGTTINNMREWVFTANKSKFTLHEHQQ